jgi:hypothetical protein
MDESKLPKGPITAEELMRIKGQMLSDDPGYRAKVEAAEAERRAIAARMRDAEQPIVEQIGGHARILSHRRRFRRGRLSPHREMIPRNPQCRMSR